MFLDPDVDIQARFSPIKPPWKILQERKEKKLPKGSPKSERDKDFLAWFEITKTTLQWLSRDRIETMVNNLLWYTGEYDRTVEYRMVVPGRSDISIPRRIMPRIFNHLHDITEQRVSKLSRYKPGFDVVPTNAETNDRIVSRLIKTSQEAVARRVHFEFLMQEAERWNSVFGEIFFGIEWNKNIGDRKSRGSIERVGDVDIYIKAPWTVLPEPKRNWAEVRWCFDIESIMQVDEARVRFDKPDLEPDGTKNIFCFNNDVEEKREDELVIWRLTVPPSQFIPEGSVIYVANNTILQEDTQYPYSHNEFPWERHTDLDVPGRLFPMSFYQQVKPIQHVYNKLTSIITRNILLTCHPHVLMPKGAAKIEAFGNRPTAIEYTGQTKPEIVTWPSVTNEIFQFRQSVLSEIGQVSGIQGVSRGAPPPGARAASMLRFYEEQEEQRASTQIIKHNEFIRRTHLKSCSVIGDYYPTSGKDRLVRVVGKENEYLIEKFAGVKISSEYDVIIQNSTGFSDSMALRIEEVERMQKLAPGLLSNEQIADILETKNPQKAYDIATVAIKKAEMENEMFLDGKGVPAPEAFEDLIAHWRTHSIFFNSPMWNYVPDEAKEEAKMHQTITERFMEQKAQINASFAQQLSMLAGYPMFWTPTPQPKPAPAAPATPPGMPPPAPGSPEEQAMLMGAEAAPIPEMPMGEGIDGLELPPVESAIQM